MITEEAKQRFVKYFHLIKASVGWTAEEFAERVGTTRQTINNVQSNKFRLSNILYAAMRYALDEEIRDKPEETYILKVILDAFVDNPNDYERYPEETRKEILEKANLLVPAIKAKTCDRKMVSEQWLTLITSVTALTAGIITAIALGTWYKNK